MRGVVLKSHHELTVGRAAVVNAALGECGLTVYGSITLNHAVGGVSRGGRRGAANGRASCLDANCGQRRACGRVRCEWALGRPASCGFALGGRTSSAPITILCDGRLIDAALEVLALCHEHDVALATGHLGQAEIRALVEVAQERRFRRLIITHPLFCAPGFAPAELGELAREGVFFSSTYCSVSPMLAAHDD